VVESSPAAARHKVFEDLQRLYTFIANRLRAIPSCKAVTAGDMLVNKKRRLLLPRSWRLVCHLLP
jgi:hypothetical protein